MLALLASILVAAALLFPALIQRTFVDQFVPLRFLSRSRSEELTRAFISILLPMILSVLVCLWLSRGFQSWAQPYGAGGHRTLVADARLVFEAVYSEPDFAKAPDKYLDAAIRLFAVIWRLIATLYLFSVAQAIVIAIIFRKFGPLHHWLKRHRADVLARALEQVVKPRVSFWHTILTPFLEPDPKTIVMLDVLVAEDKLYRGRYASHDAEREGSLRGILLREPKRFDRRKYERDKENGKNPDKKRYWKKIPSQSLYFPAAKIVNLNVTHEPRELNAETTHTAVATLLGRDPTSFTIIVREKTAAPPKSSKPRPRSPKA